MLLLCAEELISHTATIHLSFSQVRRLLCKQDLGHESLLGLLFSRKINYQFKQSVQPFLCDSKAIGKAPWMPFFQSRKKKTTAALLPSSPFPLYQVLQFQSAKSKKTLASAAMVSIYCQGLLNTDDYLRRDKTIYKKNMFGFCASSPFCPGSKNE